MTELLAALQADFEHIHTKTGAQFCWEPSQTCVVYNPEAIDGAWSLLHEFGHALLDHRSYRSDFELVRMEVAAWHKATELAARYGLQIAEDHIQDCLDTYRDWLHHRSVCPGCGCQSLQRDGSTEYECFNCHAVWTVSASRFCRPYRRTTAFALKKSASRR